MPFFYNTSGVTTDGNGNPISYTPLSSTSYGQPTGLFGINCGHFQYPFRAGVNFQRYFPYDEEENAERYKQVQKFRALERNVRSTKRELMMYDETGDKEAFQKASVKLKQQKKAMNDYAKGNNLAVRNNRIQVYGYDRSVSGKAVWANKKEVDKYSKIHYNKDGTIIVTDDWKNKSKPQIPQNYKPNAVIETQTTYKDGRIQIDRSIYDENGKLKTQIHSGNHNKPNAHPYGENGEHHHYYVWYDNEKHPERITDELTPNERKEHSDIL